MDDFEFIISEIIRFQKMPLGSLKKLSQWDALAMLPHPKGEGSLICGQAAYSRFLDLAKLALFRSQQRGCLDPARVCDELKNLFVTRLLAEGRPLTSREADHIVATSIRKAAQGKTTLVHFIPCHLGHAQNPESFHIGPVHFRKQEAALSRLEVAIETYKNELPHPLKGEASAEQKDNVKKLGEKLASDALRYYQTFGWIAEVKIEGFDVPTSRKRANELAQNALDCLHLLIGAAYSSHMRSGGPGFHTDSRAIIEQQADGSVEITTSKDWLSHNLGETWWEWINEEGGNHYVELMGLAIETGSSVPAPAPLAQRFLDAVSWYGEAVRDQYVASRIVKYITAIERILITRKVDNLAKVFRERGAALTFDPGAERLADLQEKFKKIYDVRSRLVHGSRSPTAPDLGQIAFEAEGLARKVLFRALILFRSEGIVAPEVTKKTLEETYDKVIKWANSCPAQNC